MSDYISISHFSTKYCKECREPYKNITNQTLSDPDTFPEGFITIHLSRSDGILTKYMKSQGNGQREPTKYGKAEQSF